jgi:pimeloyl-ACP methyl ester carboxylesterase
LISLVKFTLVLLVFLYLLILSYFYFFQEKLIFVPQGLNSNYKFNIQNVEEVKIKVNQAEISALHYKRPNPKGLVFFLHGNGGNLSSWLTDTLFYEKINYDLLMIDYRGYGKSTGQIKSEEQLLEDVKSCWDSVAKNYQGKKIIIFGRSLGTVLAAYLSQLVSPDLTILVAPFYSLDALRKLYYPWVPGQIMRYELDTSKYIRDINNPIVIVHGELDEVIPFSQSELLVKENVKARLKVIKEAKHNDIHVFGEYYAYLRDVIEGI